MPNGRVPTMYAAHWYASIRLEDHQISYASTDALIDEHFQAHPTQLPESVTIEEMLASSDVLNETERHALKALIAGLPIEMAIPLTDHVARNHGAQEKLTESRELSSEKRNQITAMEYKLSLVPLARRSDVTRTGGTTFRVAVGQA